MPAKPLWKRLFGPAFRRLRSVLARLRPARVAALFGWSVGSVRAVLARRGEPRLTVAVDVSPYWEPLTGVGWYLDRVLRSLADRDDLRLRLYGEDVIAAPGVPAPASPLPAGRSIEVVRYEVPEDTALPPGLLARLLNRLRPLLIAADRNRVVFAPNFYPPRRFEPAIGIGGARLVATLHDLAFRHVPWAVGDETLELLSRHLARTLREAARIVTPSEAVRRELAREGLAPPGRIRAIHHGPGQLAVAGPASLPRWAPERYALFVGTVEPRKNLETLIEAWRLLERRLDVRPALVVCGRSGWKDERLRREIEAGVAEGWLHQPGYVANEELAALFRGALFLAFPSHYEGFGLPVLEAFAAGTPVVASDLPVLREVAGDAALFAPPLDSKAWVRQIERLLDDPGLARELARAGRDRADLFSWKRAAEEHAEVFQAAAESSA
jgi:alpha-1,3-rhamnosyl/mannosyltransferase